MGDQFTCPDQESLNRHSDWTWKRPAIH